jgi:dipeptidyl aminopeptidase/acylaminoacyl peptidase
VFQQTQDGTTHRLDLDTPAAPVACDETRLLLDGRDVDRAVGTHSNGEVTWHGHGTPIGFLDGDPVALRGGEAVYLPSGDAIDLCTDVADGDAESGGAAFVTGGTDEEPPPVLGWTEGQTGTVAETTYEFAPSAFTDAETACYSDSEGEERGVRLRLPDETPAPAVVSLYGRFTEAADHDGHHERPKQYLLRAGYAVLEPGYGGEIYSVRRSDDYAAAARWAAQQDWCTGQVVAIGHSSGGYDALMSATRHPDAWDAFVAWNPLVGPLSFYGAMPSDRPYFESELGIPRENGSRTR